MAAAMLNNVYYSRTSNERACLDRNRKDSIPGDREEDNIRLERCHSRSPDRPLLFGLAGAGL
jgi:hypothetical protein